jgi:hypothetical protein
LDFLVIINHPDSYCSAESFCVCGKTIFQYVDIGAKEIIYRENWNTPTGWYHKSDKSFKCGDDYVNRDEDFPIRCFRNYAVPSYEMKRIELVDS